MELHHSSLFSFVSYDIPARSLAQMATPISSSMGEVGHVILRTIIRNIWLERNAHIFYAKYSITSSAIAKSVYMFLSWLDVTPETKKARLKGSTVMGKCSLEFLGHNTILGEEQLAEKRVRSLLLPTF